MEGTKNGYARYCKLLHRPIRWLDARYARRRSLGAKPCASSDYGFLLYCVIAAPVVYALILPGDSVDTERSHRHHGQPANPHTDAEIDAR